MISSQVMLTKTNLNGNNAYYAGQIVTFKCIVQGVSQILTWISDDYIGPGRTIQLHGQGQTRHGRTPSTVATLNSTTTNSDTHVTKVVSYLNITVSLQYPTSSVSCKLNSHGTPNISTFRKANRIMCHISCQYNIILYYLDAAACKYCIVRA